MLRFFVVVAALAVLASPALAKNFKWTCVYPSAASPKGVLKDELKLEFMLDDITGTAVVIGNAGMSPIDVHLGYLGATFMEKLASGAVQTTTIAKGGDSVHSRHPMLGGGVTPSQYYGTCRVQ